MFKLNELIKSQLENLEKKSIIFIIISTQIILHLLNLNYGKFYFDIINFY
jgi:hypothetical protein